MSEQTGGKAASPEIVGIRYNFPDHGLMVEWPNIETEVKFRLNYPLPPNPEIPKVDDPNVTFTPRRFIINFELLGSGTQDDGIDVTLIIYITQDDIKFAGDLLSIKIQKFVNDDWIPLVITERKNIYPSIMSNFGESYVGYCKVAYNSKGDPPIAVGK